MVTDRKRSGSWSTEGREKVGGLASQGDDEGECVWFGKWVAGICVSLGITFFFVRT